MNKLPLNLHGLLLVCSVADFVLCASADAQDNVNMVHPCTLHPLSILVPSGVRGYPASEGHTEMLCTMGYGYVDHTHFPCIMNSHYRLCSSVCRMPKLFTQAITMCLVEVKESNDANTFPCNMDSHYRVAPL